MYVCRRVGGSLKVGYHEPECQACGAQDASERQGRDEVKSIRKMGGGFTPENSSGPPKVF